MPGLGEMVAIVAALPLALSCSSTGQRVLRRSLGLRQPVTKVVFTSEAFAEARPQDASIQKALRHPSVSILLTSCCWKKRRMIFALISDASQML